MFRPLQAFVVIGLLALGVPAQALDCADTKADRDEVEAAICDSPDLQKADVELNDVYVSLYRGRGREEQQILKQLQLAWLEDGRNSGCNGIDAACLLGNMRDRVDFLKSADGIGPNSQGKLVFKGVYKARKKPSDTLVSIAGFEFADPDTDGKKAFNASVEKLIKDDDDTLDGKTQTDDGTSESEGDCSSCEESVTMRQPFQTANFISVQVDSWIFLGGAHGEAATEYINQFLDKAEPLAFDDLFQDYDASVLAKLCYDQIKAEYGDFAHATTDAGGKKPRPSNIFMGNFRDPSNWQFDGQSLTVNFGMFVLGAARADGEQGCTLSYDVLKPHLAEEAVLPVGPAKMRMIRKATDKTNGK